MKSLKELGITEGPWFIPSANVWRVIGDGGKRIIVENAIAENVYFGQDKIGWEGVEDTSEAFHNNILIASAPEMLEALIFLLNSCESEWPSTFKNITRDIIEKACYPKKWEEIKQILIGEEVCK